MSARNINHGPMLSNNRSKKSLGHNHANSYGGHQNLHMQSQMVGQQDNYYNMIEKNRK